MAGCHHRFWAGKAIVMNKNYAVFIDDDDLMLKAIRRTAKRLFPDWQVSLIEAPKEWQAKIDTAPSPDIVFCDYRMPQITGAEILKSVAKNYPLAIRVLVTGDTSDEAIVTCNQVAHTLLAKPFTDEQLIEFLEHVATLKALNLSTDERRLICQSSQIPVLPDVVTRLREALANDQSELPHLAEIVSKEPIIAARLLQMANSAYLGYHRATDSLEEAIARIGTQLLHAMTMSFSIEKATEHLLTANAHQQICQYTEQYAQVTRRVFMRLSNNKAQTERAFICAVLSGIGRLVMAALAESDRSAYDEFCNTHKQPAMLISAFLLTLWCYPDNLHEELLQVQASPVNPDISIAQTLLLTQQYLCHRDDNEAMEEWLSTLPAVYAEAFSAEGEK